MSRCFLGLGFGADVDPVYRREQYLIVQQYLDPYSRKEFTIEKEREIQQMQDRLEKLEIIYNETMKVKE